MELEIRSATASDIPEVERLVRELALLEGLMLQFPPGFAAGYLSHPETEVLLARENGQVVGLLSCWTHPNLFHAGLVCLIEELIVVGDARNRGVGAGLLEAAVRFAQQRGCAEISVSTLPSNQGALKFYRRHGFTDEALLLERHFQA